jgi:hypothetical protein
MRSCTSLKRCRNAFFNRNSTQLTSLRLWGWRIEQKQGNLWELTCPYMTTSKKCEEERAIRGQSSYTCKQNLVQRWLDSHGQLVRGYCAGSELANQLQKVQSFTEAPKKFVADEYEVGIFYDFLSCQKTRHYFRKCQIDSLHNTRYAMPHRLPCIAVGGGVPPGCKL